MRYTVLIVEDQQEISSIVAKYLEKEGYATICAKNGLEALESFGSNRIHLTLLDIMSVDDNIIDNLDLKLNSKKLGQFIREELNEREQKIIVLRYGLDGKEAMTQKSVAKMLGISRSYVSRIETKALKQLRKRFETSSNL